MADGDEQTLGGGREELEPFFERTFKPIVGGLILQGATVEEAMDAVQMAMQSAAMHWTRIDSPEAYVRRAAFRIFLRAKAKTELEDPVESITAVLDGRE